MSVEPAERSGDPTPASARDPSVPTLRAWWVLIAGAVGLVSSITLMVEKIDILLNPSYVPSCNVDPIISCGSVMITPQASVLGYPNPLAGIVAFTVVLVVGVLAVAKVSIPQWFWSVLAAGLLVGTGFVHWLIFQSLYRIGALCPYCMVVWAMTITLLVVVASIALSPVLDNRDSTVARLLYQWRWSLTALWFTAVFLLIMVRFWDYWSTLL
ncbi:vitamin K epoxide reductase family protein [Mycobacterium montefiorense]|uniref:vitamin K epoxide reductase family protein n=1 Tax=Mycobacterium montefiorense TaxID=154654 RepID=UPI0021F370B6|nr:vitamin K epoxide reductase family protein [Mycobacterium montefiorense]MCV7427762.1 vitamin K epoxide reductase family protein [Mycobacterium montefiorense]